MIEILMPALMYMIVFFGAVVMLTAFFVTLASIFDRFHQDEWPHLNE